MEDNFSNFFESLRFEDILVIAATTNEIVTEIARLLDSEIAIRKVDATTNVNLSLCSFIFPLISSARSIPMSYLDVL